MPGQGGQALAAAAKDAFVSGMALANLIGAATVLLGAVLVFAFLPARATEADVDAGFEGGLDAEIEATLGRESDPSVSVNGGRHDDPTVEPSPVLA
jgi:hypothetical protein